MVYVDELIDYGFSDWRRGEWCHMSADTLEELHDMANKIGMKISWFQNKPRFPHYDLRAPKRLLALQNGAIEITALEMARNLRQDREVD